MSEEDYTPAAVLTTRLFLLFAVMVGYRVNCGRSCAPAVGACRLVCTLLPEDKMVL